MLRMPLSKRHLGAERFKGSSALVSPGRLVGRASSSGDATLTLNYNFLLDSGSTIAQVAVKGPALTYSGNGGTSMIWNESAVLVSTADNSPRFDHNPVSGAAKGLLMEEARDNICLQAEALGTTWTLPGGNTTLSSFATAAPDGNATAEDVLHGDNAETVQQTITVTDNTVVVISAFVHQGTTGSHDWVKMSWLDDSDGDNGFEAWFDLSTGNVGTAQAQGTGSYTASSAAMVDVGGGWFRISAIGQIVSGQTDGRIELINTTADAVDTAEATNSVAWWGLQVEEGGFLTSYIPTTTVSVTRTADRCFVNDVTWFNTNAGTFVITALSGGDLAEKGWWSFTLSGNLNRMRMIRRTNNKTQNFITNSADADGATISSGTIADFAVFKEAMAFADDDMGVSLNGESVVTDLALGIPLSSVPTQLLFGNQSFNNSASSDQYFQSFKYYNERKDNDFLVAEST